MSPHPWYIWVLAAFVAVGSIARTARLLVWDGFPPVEWLRLKFFTAVGDSPWRKLGECAFCLAPYLTLGMFVWAYLSDLHWTFLVINGWWTAAYLAAIWVSYDQPADGTD